MNKKINKMSLLIVLLFLFVICYYMGGFNYFKDINKLKNSLNNLGRLRYLMYIFAYIITAIFSLPASILTIVGGIIFGPLIGGILALIGATIGALVSFLISRYLFRDFIVSKFKDNLVFNKIEEGFKRNGKDFLILTRLLPVFPYNIQNYAYGITNIDVSTYVIVSFITMAPGAFIYTCLADEIINNGLSNVLYIKLLIFGVILFLLSQIPKILAKKKGIDIATLK
ncbi:TVP38/TMEM64 family protein [Thermobrachium celere]|uniref:TVP38/TMEM64 family protein n=1 Tax=Thermobrachium celere TaxID=53422 RepID=UPI0019438C29|nr:TVP38/TMEM64 family protein [Thermobrachium celere]GFR35728.1 TVP38/TMEM64 family protein [Thermobrachium celere]